MREIENRFKELHIPEYIIKNRSPEVSKFIQGNVVMYCTTENDFGMPYANHLRFFQAVLPESFFETKG